MRISKERSSVSPLAHTTVACQEPRTPETYTDSYQLVQGSNGVQVTNLSPVALQSLNTEAPLASSTGATPASASAAGDESPQDPATPSPANKPSAQLSTNNNAQPTPSDPASTSRSVNIGGIIASALDPSTTRQADSQTSVQDPGSAPSGDDTSDGTDSGSGGESKAPAANTPAANMPLATVGSQTIAADPSNSGGVVVGGTKTLQPGESTVINNTPVSVGTSQVVVGTDSSTIAIPSANAASSQPIAIVGGQTVAANPSGSGVVIAGSQTLQPGQTTVINSIPVSVGTSQVVVGSSTIAVPSAAGSNGGSSDPNTGAVVHIGGSQVTAVAVGSSGAVQVAGQTLTPGQVATISGHVVSDASIGLVVDGSTAGFSRVVAHSEALVGALSASGAVITAGSQVLTALQSSGTAVVDGQTLAPGQVATVNGHTISDASTGLVVDGSTAAFSQLAVSTQASGAVITAGEKAFTALASSGTAVFDGQTLTAGDVATVNGHVVSDASTGLVLDGSTVAFSQIETSQSAPVNGAVFSVGSRTFTAQETEGTAIFDGQTLTPGQVTVMSGHTVSDASTGLVVDGSTLSFSQIASPTLSGAVVTVGPATYSAVEIGGTVAFDGQTLTPGQVATISGHVFSDVSTGLVVDGSTVPFSQLAGATNAGAVSSGAVITEGSNTYAALETSGTVIYDGHTLTPGEQTVLDGQTISDASTALVFDGTTHPFSQITPAPVSGVVFTAGSEVLTASELADGDYMIDGTTLSRGGPAVTIDGQVVSDGISGLVLGSTKTLPPSVVGPTVSAASDPTTFKAAAAALRRPLDGLPLRVIVGSMALVLLSVLVM